MFLSYTTIEMILLTILRLRIIENILIQMFLFLGGAGSCKFPFIYKGVTYTECTTKDEENGKFWCSTETDNQNNHIEGKWTHCTQPHMCQNYKGAHIF